VNPALLALALIVWCASIGDVESGPPAVIATVIPPPGEPVPGLHPHLVLKLKKGWRFDAATRTFVNARDRRCPEAAELPRGTTIVPMTPVLHERNAKTLTAPERELVRYYQVIFAAGSDARAHLDKIAQWSCAAEVRLPPVVSLPHGLP
jgi:hypothetical protein